MLKRNPFSQCILRKCQINLFTVFTISTKFSQIKVTSMLLDSNVRDVPESSNVVMVGWNQKYSFGFLIGTKNNLKRFKTHERTLK